MPGIFCQTVVFGSINTGIGLSDDLQKGLIERFRSLPMARSAVLAGRTLADLVRNVFVVLLMLIVGYAVGFRILTNVFGLLAGIGILLLFAFSMTWIFAIVGLSAPSPETAQAMSFPILAPLVFASSAFVSTSTMPGWLQVFANHQPVTAAVNATRALMIGGPTGAVRVAEPGLEHRDRGGLRPARHPPLPPGGLTGPSGRPEPGHHRGGERLGRLDHRVVADALEPGERGVGSPLDESLGHGPHRDRVEHHPTPRSAGDGWRLDGVGPPRLVLPALLDVADGPGQQAIAAAGHDQVGGRPARGRDRGATRPIRPAPNVAVEGADERVDVGRARRRAATRRAAEHSSFWPSVRWARSR